MNVIDCDISDNGGGVVPGAGFHHNLHLTRIIGGQVINSRMDTSPWGSGLDMSFVSDFLVAHNEAARNKLAGVTCAESQSIQLIDNLAEGNDSDGIALPVYIVVRRISWLKTMYCNITVAMGFSQPVWIKVK